MLNFTPMNFPHRKRWFFLFFSCLLFIGFSAWAADSVSATPQIRSAITTPPVINTGDNAWVLASSALVLMMTAPGLMLILRRFGAQ